MRARLAREVPRRACHAGGAEGARRRGGERVQQSSQGGCEALRCESRHKRNVRRRRCGNGARGEHAGAGRGVRFRRLHAVHGMGQAAEEAVLPAAQGGASARGDGFAGPIRRQDRPVFAIDAASRGQEHDRLLFHVFQHRQPPRGRPPHDRLLRQAHQLVLVRDAGAHNRLGYLPLRARVP